MLLNACPCQPGVSAVLMGLCALQETRDNTEPSGPPAGDKDLLSGWELGYAVLTCLSTHSDRRGPEGHMCHRKSPASTFEGTFAPRGHQAQLHPRSS